MALTLTIDAVPAIILAEPLIIEVTPLRAGLNGEVPNCTVVVANVGGDLTALFADPPLRAAATLTDGSETLFTGAVHALTLDDTIRIELEA